MSPRSASWTAPPLALETLLLDERLVDEQRLREARRVALRRHLPLVEVLIDEHVVDEERLAAALALRLGLPRAKSADIGRDEEALREVPHDLATAHLAVPLELVMGATGQRLLHLAMVNPLDAHALEDLAHASGCSLKPTIATLTDIRAAIQRSYRGLITKMIPRLGTSPTGEPTTQPHLQLPDETSLDLRLRALVELLEEKGVATKSELDERVRRLVRGDDV